MRVTARLFLLSTLGAALIWALGAAWAQPSAPGPSAEAPAAAEAAPPSAAPAVQPQAADTAITASAVSREEPADWTTRLRSVLGGVLIVFVAWVMSSARKRVNWALVAWGLGLQCTFALFIFQPIWMSLTLLSALMLCGAALQGADEQPMTRRLMARSPYVAPMLGVPLVALLLPTGSGALGQVRDAVFVQPLGRTFFDAVNNTIVGLLAFTEEGSTFLLRSFATNTIHPALGNFVFAVLPTIIFFSALMSVLYHVGIMQVVVGALAGVMQRTMRTSGAESMSAASNIFLGQTEAPLVVKPYVATMTESELMAVMTGGFATVAGGVLAAYVGMLKGYFPDIAGHLMAASIMNAPAGLVLAKLMVPETDTPKTFGKTTAEVERLDANVIGAAARGAGEGMQLAINVAAMLLAFIALIACLNSVIGLFGRSLASTSSMVWATLVLSGGTALYYRLSKSEVRFRRALAIACGVVLAGWWLLFAIRGAQPVALSMQSIFGTLLKPVAWMMGVSWTDSAIIGGLLGEKLVLNEFFAYAHLGQMLQGGQVQLSERSVTLVTYGLLGFANFSSIAIQIGGIGGIAPSRRDDLARLGLRAMIAGTLAAYLSACIASVLIP